MQTTQAWSYFGSEDKAYLDMIWVIKMKNILSILALAFIVSMLAVPASAVEITSPVAGQKYYVWDNMPIELDNLEEGYFYTTFVNGVPAEVFAPERGGKYVIKVFGENPDCETCPDDTAEQIIRVDPYPPVEKTRIKIISPEVDFDYHVNDVVPIEFESQLKDRTDFIFKTYVTDPNGVTELTETWAPKETGKYIIRVEALGIDNGFRFCSSFSIEID